MTTRIKGSGLSQYYWHQDNATFDLTGNNDFIVLNSTTNAIAFIYGTNDTLSVQSDTNLAIYDRGHGTTINGCGASTLNVYGFQNDPTGTIKINRSLTAPTLASDGKGGTMVTWSTGHADFIKDPNLSPAQVYFGATSLAALDPVITVNQPNQVVPLNNATNTTVVLQATGALIELTNACQITVDDFTRGMNAHVIFENQGQYAQNVANDGHGGTLVQCGPASVDFAGVVLDPERGQVTYTSGDIANRLLEVNSL